MTILRVGAACVGLAVLSVSGEAEACSPLACEPAHLAPGAAAEIPYNAPAIVFDPGENRMGSPFAEWRDGGLTIREDSSGRAGYVLVEEDPLLPGVYLLRTALDGGETYTVRYPDTCVLDGGSAGQDPDAGWLEVRFAAGARADLPTTAGTLSVAENGVATVHPWTQCGSCTYPAVAARARLDFQSSAALTPYLPITRYVLSVDGVLWTSTRYGGGAWLMATRRIDEVFAVCAPSLELGDDDGLTQGLHHVELQAHVAGAASDPPALAVDVVLSCGSVDAGPPHVCYPQPNPDAGGGGGDGGGSGGPSGGDNEKPGGCFGLFGALALMGAALVLRLR